MEGVRPRKYELPASLSRLVEQRKYERWLHWRAVAHARHDKERRRNPRATVSGYKFEIHRAVIASRGLDHYTGEKLNWSLIGTYSNTESKKRGKDYKRQFALLPSVDHVWNSAGLSTFRICAWRTNDAKSDLSYREFVRLCEKVLERAGGRSH